MNSDNLIERLKIARRELDCLYPDVQLLKDWNYDKHNKLWYIRISINIHKENPYFPSKSYWYVTVEPYYPKGQIKIYPDIDNSINTTLFHQANNYRVNKNGIWREGSLCVSENILSGMDSEPLSVEYRLVYHVKRAIEWLVSASNDSLVEKKELFELPEYNYNLDLINVIFVFSEDVVTYMQWEDCETKYGLADIDCYRINPSIYYVKTFYDFNGKQVHYTTWGSHLSRSHLKKPKKAAWILMNKIPVLREWQVPETWNELVLICKQQNIDIMAVLKQTAMHMRDGIPHFLLLGFPVPKYFNGENELIIWQAIQLPVLSFGNKTIKGFRTNENGYWQRDCREVLKPQNIISWIQSENWNQNEISQRGKIDKEIQRMNIALIGAGCIGSAISEIIVRSGCYNITIIDNDFLKIGNLSRHTLNLYGVEQRKSQFLSSHLNLLQPNADIKFINEKLRLINNDEEISFNINLEDFDIILDCSGNNELLNDFEKITFRKPHLFVSVSIGLGAKHLYLNIQNDYHFCFDKFATHISKYIDLESKELDYSMLPRDGIGCWHPTFPARADDVLMAASISVKAIEKYILENTKHQLSLVYEQKASDYYEGFSLILFKKD